MCEPISLDRERVAQTFAALRDSLRTERRRTAAERRAFETFADRVASVDFSNAGSGRPSDGETGADPGGTVVSNVHAGSKRDAPIVSIRRAFEETVMAVSFYDDEYGDDYRESLAAEFGPEVATALTDPNCFGPAAKAPLTAAIQRAVREREHLIELCTDERESVDAAASILLPVAAELDGIGSPDPGNDSFGSLEADWNRLSRLHDHCETAVADRQSAINDRRSRHDLPVDAPDVCAYFYEARDSAYPVLAACVELAQRAATLQTAYERAMAEY